MNVKHLMPGILLAGLVLVSPLIGYAAPPADPGNDGGNAPGGSDFHARREPMPGAGFGAFPGSERGWDVPPSFLAGLILTDEQQDKVFAILYAAAPAIREQAKALRKAREALDDLTTTAQYGETRAKGLAEASAKADSQLALLRARTQREIYLLLTPEQRAQMSDRRRPHGHGGPPAP